jgi:hypothetical protein
MQKPSRRACLLIALLAPAALAQTPKAADPVAVVRMYYNDKIKDEAIPRSARLKALYAAAAKKSKEIEGPVSGLDFDVASGAQDSEENYRRTLRLALVSKTDRAAVVKATFKNFRQREHHYSLVMEDGRWKVDDVRDVHKKEGWLLSDLLKEGAKGN